jgi:hypothetical protein
MGFMSGELLGDLCLGPLAKLVELVEPLDLRAYSGARLHGRRAGAARLATISAASELAPKTVALVSWACAVVQIEIDT